MDVNNLYVVRLWKANWESFLPYLLCTEYEEDNPSFLAAGLVEKGRSCGAITGICQPEGSFLINGIYVDDAFRGYGGGKLLLSFFLNEIHTLHCQKIQEFVTYMASGNQLDENAALAMARFYKEYQDSLR